MTLPGEPRLAVLLEKNDPNRRARYRSRVWVEGQMRAVLSHKNGNVWKLFKRKEEGLFRVDQGQGEGQIGLGIFRGQRGVMTGSLMEKYSIMQDGRG